MHSVIRSLVSGAVLLVGIVANAADFDPDTGLRIHNYTATTPDSIPGGTRIDVDRAYDLWQQGALFVDVLSISQGRYDELDGTWPEHSPRNTIPGAIWLPNTGFGRPSQDMQEYLMTQVQDALAPDQAIVVFCVADCWMGWNALQHLSAMGYQDLYWFADGTTAWESSGYPVELVEPVPVDVD